MTPLLLFGYGVAIGLSIVAVALSCAFAYLLFCFITAPRSDPEPRTLRN